MEDKSKMMSAFEMDSVYCFIAGVARVPSDWFANLISFLRVHHELNIGGLAENGGEIWQTWRYYEIP